MNGSRGNPGAAPDAARETPGTGGDGPDRRAVATDVRRALSEDIGDGDRTARLVPEDARACALVLSREDCVVSGRPWFDEVFAQLEGGVRIAWSVRDGECVSAGHTLCTLEGPARALLTGERTALNFLQLLCGVATRTRRFVAATAGTRARILDTRKTLPGLRVAQKFAVRCGGGHNHRMGLYDALLIKENHIAACGSLSAAVYAARRVGPQLPVEVEVEDLGQLREALEARVERVLLDNFDLESLRRAVTLTGGRARLEASGGVRYEQVAAVAATGVDDISIGTLTKDVRAVDLSMRFHANGTDGPDGAA